MRKDLLVNESFYHIFNRSIAKFEIFNKPEEYARFLAIAGLFKYADFQYKYSEFTELDVINQYKIISALKNNNNLYVRIVAYCIMPTHFHLILEQKENDGISKYMAKLLNSYSRYFNLKHNRKGPLWEGKFKSVLIENDKQLLHLTRYIHLNPVSAKLINNPEKWQYSSYNEYIKKDNKNICDFRGLFDLNEKKYIKFVRDRISYQKDLSEIKHLLIENYSG